MTRFRSAFVAALACAATTGGAVADEASVVRHYDGPPEALWSIVGDLCSIGAWYSAVTACEVVERDDETIRRVTFEENAVFVERIVEYDAQAMRYAYEVLDGAPQVEGYVAVIDIDAHDDGARVEWSSRYTPVGVTSDQARSFLTSVYETDLDRLFALADGADAGE